MPSASKAQQGAARMDAARPTVVFVEARVAAASDQSDVVCRRGSVAVVRGLAEAYVTRGAKGDVTGVVKPATGAPAPATVVLYDRRQVAALDASQDMPFEDVWTAFKAPVDGVAGAEVPYHLCDPQEYGEEKSGTDTNTNATADWEALVASMRGGGDRSATVHPMRENQSATVKEVGGACPGEMEASAAAHSHLGIVVQRKLRKTRRYCATWRGAAWVTTLLADAAAGVWLSSWYLAEGVPTLLAGVDHIQSEGAGYCQWLLGQPAGFKGNPQLNEALGLVAIRLLHALYVPLDPVLDGIRGLHARCVPTGDADGDPRATGSRAGRKCGRRRGDRAVHRAGGGRRMGAWVFEETPRFARSTALAASRASVDGDDGDGAAGAGDTDPPTLKQQLQELVEAVVGPTSTPRSPEAMATDPTAPTPHPSQVYADLAANDTRVHAAVHRCVLGDGDAGCAAYIAWMYFAAPVLARLADVAGVVDVVAQRGGSASSPLDATASGAVAVDAGAGGATASMIGDGGVGGVGVLVVWFIAGMLGASGILALTADILGLGFANVKLTWFTLHAASHALKQALIQLSRLLRGKKYNYLRQRVDAHTFDTHQKLLGTLVFTLLVFLFPTFMVYSVFFTLYAAAVATAQEVLALAAVLCLSTPLLAAATHPITAPYDTRMRLQFRRGLAVHGDVAVFALAAPRASVARAFAEPAYVLRTWLADNPVAKFRRAVQGGESITKTRWEVV